MLVVDQMFIYIKKNSLCDTVTEKSINLFTGGTVAPCLALCPRTPRGDGSTPLSGLRAC